MCPFLFSVPSGQRSTANCGADLKRCFQDIPFRTAFTSDCGVLSVPRLDEDSLAFSLPLRWMSQCFELTSSKGAFCECCSLCDSFEELTALTFQPSVSKKENL